MQPDNELHLNQAEQTGDEAKEFGRASEVGPGPTKQDPSLGCLDKYDLLFIPDEIAIRCIGCMEYIWQHKYSYNIEDVTSLINEFSFNKLVMKIINHHLSCSFWNK